MDDIGVTAFAGYDQMRENLLDCNNNQTTESMGARFGGAHISSTRLSSTEMTKEEKLAHYNNLIKPTMGARFSRSSHFQHPLLTIATGPTSTLQKGCRRRGKGPYIGVRLRGGRWVSEIRIPKTKTRIWLGSHRSPEKAALAYDAALYCLKGEQASFNFPNNRRPNLAHRSVGSLHIDEIQCIAAEFSCLDEPSMETSEPSPRSTHQLLDPPVLTDPQRMNERDSNKVDDEPHVPAYVPEEEPYIPTFVPEEEPYVPAYVSEVALASHGNLKLDEWLALDGEWMKSFN